MTLELFREWFYCDSGGTVFWRKSPKNGVYPGDFAGALHKGYLKTQLKGRKYPNQNIVWVLENGEDIPEGLIIDHRDGNPLNNRPSNLRLATLNQNQWNKLGNNRLKGVNKYRNGKYRASIGYYGKVIHLGYYDTPEEAKIAYDTAALEYHKEFAHFGTNLENAEA